MSNGAFPQNPYLLLTPGPLSTSLSVKTTMLRDWCTWDVDYNEIVESIRADLLALAKVDNQDYTSVLMQGSGTFSIESVIGSAVPVDGQLLVLSNGIYGRRMAKIAEVLGIPTSVCDSGETSPTDLHQLELVLNDNPAITHVGIVHCETTTGMLNPVDEVGKIVKSFGKSYIIDAMSSFGGIEMDVAKLQVDFLISSANKCIQGVPGFGFIIARRKAMQCIQGRARSLSLDLFGQWQAMENGGGKWRFTSPTHVVRAFAQALLELQKEGGISARSARYRSNQVALVKGMSKLDFTPLLAEQYQSSIITSFMSPTHSNYSFDEFYRRLKNQGFVIYPGKVSDSDTFRIGNIGEIYAQDIKRLLSVIAQNRFWLS